MGFARDVQAWCSRTGNRLVNVERENRENKVTIEKGAKSRGGNRRVRLRPVRPVPEQRSILPKTRVRPSSFLTVIWIKLLAAFIIANGAAAMGRPVTMFLPSGA